MDLASGSKEAVGSKEDINQEDGGTLKEDIYSEEHKEKIDQYQLASKALITIDEYQKILFHKEYSRLMKKKLEIISSHGKH